MVPKVEHLSRWGFLEAGRDLLLLLLLHHLIFWRVRFTFESRNFAGENWRRIQADGVALTSRKNKTDASVVVASTFANPSGICDRLCVKATQQYTHGWTLHNTGSAADLLQLKPDDVGRMAQRTTFTQW